MIQRMRPFGAFGLGADSSTVSAMEAAIIKMEGYNPNFAPNNNPGNLVYAGQRGAKMGAGGFAAFPTYADGVTALDKQIAGQIDKGQSLTDFFNQYAPGNTKNAAGGIQTPAATQNYINFVSAQLGIDPNVPINQSTPASATATGDTSYADAFTDNGGIVDDTVNAGTTDFTPYYIAGGIAFFALLIYSRK